VRESCLAYRKTRWSILRLIVQGAVFGGLLLTATVEDIVPEADERGAPRRISSPSFAAGFALLLLMSAYLGG
jgi:zinc transporter ZupT